MDRSLKMSVIMLYLAVVGFRQSSGARLLVKDILPISVRNQWMLYPNLNAGGGLLFSALKSSVASDDAQKLWGDGTKESPKAEKTLLKVAPEGSLTSSENAMVAIQQLATSSTSPGVRHVQIHASIAKSPTRSRPKRRQQKRVSKNRILQSTPSPGNGH